MKNFKPDVIKFKKPESEWTEEEHTEYTKWSLKLSMAHRFKQQIQENKPLTNRDKRIIERFRSGADFFGEKICGKETSRLFEQPYTFDLFNEWQEKHFKEHPEDKDKTIEELTGYLTGDYIEAFNEGKRQEVDYRVKHFNNALKAKTEKNESH